MTRKMKLTALTMATLATALVATTALADRGLFMNRGEGHGMERGMGPLANFDFAAVDTDQDGKITEAEMTAWRAAQAQALDADGDGFVTAEELAAMQMKASEARIKDRASRMVARMDADGDGKLSAAELATRPVPAGLFARLDTDKDGAVSQAELDAAKERMAEGGRKHMKKHGGDRNGHGQGNN